MNYLIQDKSVKSGVRVLVVYNITPDRIRGWDVCRTNVSVKRDLIANVGIGPIPQAGP